MHTIAVDIGAELEVQNDKLDTVNEKATEVNQQFVTINHRIKSLVQRMGGCERIIPTTILVVVIIGIVGYIISLVTK
jgi:predicted membrane chloride channel (bestrophin family)